MVVLLHIIHKKMDKQNLLTKSLVDYDIYENFKTKMSSYSIKNAFESSLFHTFEQQ